MSDFDEALGQDVQQEAPDKLGAGDGQGLRSGVIRIVLVGEADGAGGFVHVQDAVVGDADPVGVAREIGEDNFGTGEGRFGVDDPLFTCGLVEQLSEGGRGGEGLQLPMKLQRIPAP